MAWVRFDRDCHWPERGSWSIAYKAGMRCNVTRDCARDVVALGAAAPIKAPPREHVAKLALDPMWVPAAKT